MLSVSRLGKPLMKQGVAKPENDHREIDFGKSPSQDMQKPSSAHVCIYCRGGAMGRRCKLGHSGGRPVVPGQHPSSSWNKKKKQSATFS